MKKHDRDNFNFLMTIPQEQFDAWMDNATNDDVEYALEIIRQAKAELLLEEIELRESIDSDIDFTEANMLINRLRGVKNVGKN